MGDLHQPFGGDDVCKALPNVFIADAGKIVFGLHGFHQGQKAFTLLDVLGDLGKRLRHRVETFAFRDLRAAVLFFAFLSVTFCRGAQCVGNWKWTPFDLWSALWIEGEQFETREHSEHNERNTIDASLHGSRALRWGPG